MEKTITTLVTLVLVTVPVALAQHSLSAPHIP
jgi:hypothetical protein